MAPVIERRFFFLSLRQAGISGLENPNYRNYSASCLFPGGT